MAYKFGINPNETDKWKKLTQAQDRTISDLIENINSHQIALMIRPTGFGKTYLMIEFAKRQKYSKVLYVYPMEVIRQSIIEDYHSKEIKFAATEEEHKKNPDIPYIEFCTYSKMLEDYTNVYRLIQSKPWARLSKDEKDKAKEKWDSYTDEKRQSLQEAWIKRRFSDIELLILDEAHTTGANGFLTYWPYIHKLSELRLKSNRLHILGATATPNRTASDVNIETEIFYYKYGNELKSARIPDFTIQDCWKTGIMKRPYYAKGVLDKVSEEESILGYLGSLKSKDRSSSDKTVDALIQDSEGIASGAGGSFESQIFKLFSAIDPLDSIIVDSLKKVSPHKYSEGVYLRFIVFYANSKEMMEYSKQVTSAFTKALVDNKENSYTSLNNYYIASNQKEFDNSGIKLAKVDIINDRDKSINCGDVDSAEYCNFGQNQVDLIHSIDMLNMGYHVGAVTGVVIKRSTGSEIQFYQQIGRCMSVTADEMPIILDLANADAELFNRATEGDRFKAMIDMQTFIDGCLLSESNEPINALYAFLNMYMKESSLPDEMVDFWYIDRLCPIYMLYAAAKSVGYPGGLESIMIKLIVRLRETNKTSLFQLDTPYKKEPRLNKNMAKIIDKEITVLKNIAGKGGKK